MWRTKPSTFRSKVDLNSYVVLDAAALSLARLYHFVVLCTGLFLFRLLLAWFLLPAGLTKAFIMTSEFGRFCIAIGQEISIMTYSCFYKGVHTWASPGWRRPGRTPPAGGSTSRDGDDGVRSSWERDFERNFYAHLGPNFLAVVVFRLVSSAWPLVDGALKWMGAWRPGPRIFSGFVAPRDDEFDKRAGARTFQLHVFDVQQNSSEKLLYVVRFERVPRAIAIRLKSSLKAKRILRLVLGPILFCLVLAGLVAPFMLSLGNVAPAVGVYWAVEQFAVIVLKYYDCCNIFVNTKFGREEDDLTPGYLEERISALDCSTLIWRRRSI